MLIPWTGPVSKNRLLEKMETKKRVLSLFERVEIYKAHNQWKGLKNGFLDILKVRGGKKKGVYNLDKLMQMAGRIEMRDKKKTSFTKR